MLVRLSLMATAAVLACGERSFSSSPSSYMRFFNANLDGDILPNRFRNLYGLRYALFCFLPCCGLLFLNFNDCCSAERDVIAFDWLGMGASARPSFEAADQAAAESFFLEVRRNFNGSLPAF
jgi:hypothetical protein